jgi:beta-lactam-binding protein with PASTA domain
MKLIRFLFSKAFLMQVALATGLFVLLYFVVFGGISSYTRQDETVVVPDVKNIQLSKIEGLLDSWDLRFRVIDSSEYNINFDRGAITEVYPLQGLKVKPQRELLLTVNPNIPEKVILPDVIDKSKRQAMDKLRFAGLNIGTLTYVPDMAKDVVLVMKLNGKELQPGDQIQKLSTINLVLGKGLSNERIVMPYVIGLSIGEASYQLKRFSLNTGAINFDKTVHAKDSLKAIVYKQSPYASVTPVIRMGADVDLWLTMDSTKVRVDTLFSQLP